MSRAFVSENDGWRRCVRYMEDCMMADENGSCILDHCRQHPEKEKKEADNEQNKQSD